MEDSREDCSVSPVSEVRGDASIEGEPETALGTPSDDKKSGGLFCLVLFGGTFDFLLALLLTVYVWGKFGVLQGVLTFVFFRLTAWYWLFRFWKTEDPATSWLVVPVVVLTAFGVARIVGFLRS